MPVQNPWSWLIAAFVFTACGGETKNIAPVPQLNARSSARVGEAVTFDASGSSDRDGRIKSYVFDFGDGSEPKTVGEIVTYAYSEPGTYILTVVVLDDDGARASLVREFLVTDNLAPKAVLKYTGELITGEPIHFSGADSVDEDGTIAAYSLDFGDGSGGDSVQSSHVYDQAGSYTVELKVVDDGGAISETQLVLRIKGLAETLTGPSAVITGPTEVAYGQMANFDASASKMPGATGHAYLWNLGDGTNVAGASVAHAYDPGSYFVTLRIVATYADGSTAAAAAVHLVTVRANQAPSAVFTGPSSGRVGHTLTFDSTASGDADGTISARSLAFGDGDTSVDAVAQHAYAAPGTYTVVLTITDNDGGTATATQTVTAVSYAESTTGLFARIDGPASARFGSDVSFSAMQSEASEATSVSYDWYFGDGASGSGDTAIHAYAPGNYDVRLVLTATYPDGSTAEANDENEIQVVGNTLPYPVLIGDSDGKVGEMLNWDASSSFDVDGSLASASWTFGDGATSTTLITSHAYASSGTYPVTLTVTDNDGGVASVMQDVTVTSYAETVDAPFVLFAAPVTLQAGEPLYVDAGNSHAPEADDLTYLWRFGDGATATTFAAVHEYGWEGGLFDVSLLLVATYPDGSTSYAAGLHSIEVLGNRAPIVGSASIEGAPFKMDSILVAATGVVFDYEGDLTTLEYTWFLNGVGVSNAKQLSGFARGDTAAVAVRAFDGYQYGAWVTADSVTIENAPPYATAVTLAASPAPATTGSGLSFQGFGFDLDGDAVQWISSWSINGVSTGSFDDTLAPYSAVRGDVVELRAVPHDGISFGEAVTAQVTIENTLPPAPALTLHPAAPVTGEAIWVDFAELAADADGDAVSYLRDWYRNGAIMSYPPSQTSASPSDSRWGDRWRVVVTAYDGFGSGSTADADVSVRPSDRWYGMDVAPSARYDHSAVWTGSHMIVWGGRLAGGVFTNTGAIYDPLTDSWIQITLSTPAAARAEHLAVWSDDRMLIWGGIGGSGAVADGYAFSPTSHTWTAMSLLNGPSAATGHTMVWAAGYAMVWGGYSAGVPVSDGYRYDPVADEWSAMVAGPLSARSLHTAVATGDGMLIWGGRAADGSSLGDGAIYDVGGSWQLLPGTGAPAPRERHTMVWTGSQAIVWGGMSEGVLRNDGALYDADTGSWLPLSNLDAPTARNAHRAVWGDGKMVVWGGENGTSLLGSGASYDPVSDKWETLIDAPITARRGHSMVWSGDEVLVWGGMTGAGERDDGARLDVEKQAWTSTGSNSGVPQGRRWHNAVWTGSEMLVWGGTTNTGRVNTGGRYRPTTNSWLTMSTLNTHANVDSGPVVTWVGDRMVVWGGYHDYYGAMSSGKLYNPVSDSWTDMTNLNAPTGRTSALGAWSGTELLIFGGYTIGPTFRPQGARYDPVANTWQDMTLTGSPPGRYMHHAGWAGDRFAVWGGWNGSTFFGGARYNPADNTWDTITSLSEPARRRSAAYAVLHDRYFVVWGGATGAGAVGDGGVYDAMLDSWEPIENSPLSPRNNTAFANVGERLFLWGPVKSDGALYDILSKQWRSINSPVNPHPRSDSSTVWTGREVIVWGGLRSGVYHDTGGRYVP